MAISYIEPDILNANSNFVIVKFINDENNKEFARPINIPYDSNNAIDLVEWNTRLESHLRSVIYKHNIGLIEFVDPPFDL
jgi:hypothetical protein